EGHDTGVAGAGGAAPGDALVGNLLRDLGVPLLVGAADVGLPMQALVVKLADRLDAFHETGKLLELGPLVVGFAYRHIDLYRFFNRGHGCPPSLSRVPEANAYNEEAAIVVPGT